MVPQDLGMCVDGGVDAHALRPAHHLCHLALVYRPQRGEVVARDIAVSPRERLYQ